MSRPRRRPRRPRSRAGDGQSRARLGTAAADLVAAALATRLDRHAEPPRGTTGSGMVLRVHAYVEAHPGEPSLSPAAIAATHHISLRALHKLFEAEPLSVARLIRHRRLEHCRRDPLDPRLDHLPVHAIGARWGLPEAAQFSRAFRAAYGLHPAATGSPARAPADR